MSQRFFIYPVLFIVLAQMVPLLGRDWRWYAAQIAQLSVTLVACAGGLYFSDNFLWVPAAWGLFAVFVIAPAVLTSAGAAREQRGHWRGAAALRHLAGRVAWGQTGRLYRRYSSALGLMARGHAEEALLALDDLAAQRMPVTIRGTVLMWKLSLLVTLRQWERAVVFYENVFDWGTLGQATQARMFAARAFAETGRFERALRSLQFAMLSPRTIGARQTQLWATRVCVAALAGDKESVEELLRPREVAFCANAVMRQRGHASRSRGLSRFAAYWRGRCALACGERGEAARLLTRAYGLTHPRNRLWREAIVQQVRRLEEGNLPTSWPAQDATYAHGQELLRRAEKDTAAWRALMHLGRPERATLALLLVFAVVYLAGEVFLRGELQEKLQRLAGNTPGTIADGEWWRAFTALFLHANPLHLVMNGAGLWIFGSAVEKTMGRWRFLVVFLLGGALGNLASALATQYVAVHYDVAIGASGGIFGVVGAFAVGVWRLRSPMHFALRRRLLVIVMVMVAADFTIGGLEPQVDNLAHVGGFVAGIVIALVLWPRTRNGLNIERPTSSIQP